MIQKTVAAAAFGLAATCAWGQTNVTIYGSVDGAVQSAHTGAGTTTRVDSSAVMASKIGFQGTEDLGGGMKAIFRLENGFNVDTGANAGNGALFNRESWVGMTGSLGQIQAGVNYSPLFLSYVAYSLGELNTFSWGNATNNFFFVPSSRLSNSLRYTSPAFGGLTVRAAYALGTEGAAPRTMGDTASVGFNYKIGAFSADLDYLQQKYATTTVVTDATPVSSGRYYLMAASYDFGFIKPAALYQIHTGNPDPAVSNSFANPDNRFYEISAKIPNIGNGAIMLSFGQYKRASSSSGNATSYGLRYDYHLSKRTGLYAGLAAIKNNSAASFTVGSIGTPGIATTPGRNVTSMIVGMLTTF
jgi:predicted porin